jgi:hypothetical protein
LEGNRGELKILLFNLRNKDQEIEYTKLTGVVEKSSSSISY